MDTDQLILDTHIWIWLMAGDAALSSSKALPVIEDFHKRKAIKVSVMSVWELGMLIAKGRIDLREDMHTWVNKALHAPGLSLLPLSPAAALDSSHLPGIFHGDPVDRILVSEARAHNATLVTRDRKIIRYAEAGHVRILKT
ncbi:MAG: type II toxin-antitoxin system VapC family toxin [Spartobacteria bacterium]|nr:type II toxin-antitoxin system VapC family toxin [Spartobacteria bacterium]